MGVRTTLKADDDNDGLDDDLDSCPTGLSQWEDQRALDLNMDGCLDGRESPLQQGSGVVDEQYYLDLIANQVKLRRGHLLRLWQPEILML